MRELEGSRAVFASLVRQYVAPLLSAHDYRKSKLVWNRRRPEIIQALDLQVSRWSDEEKLRFTVNLGVLVERVWQILWDRPVPRVVHEADRFPEMRVSYLLEEGPLRKDIWWTITPTTDLGAMGTELQSVLSEECIPFLDRLDSIDAIVELANDPVLRRTPPEQMPFAILKYLAGKREEALEILSALLAKAKKREDRGWQDHITAISERLTKPP